MKESLRDAAEAATSIFTQPDFCQNNSMDSVDMFLSGPKAFDKDINAPGSGNDADTQSYHSTQGPDNTPDKSVHEVRSRKGRVRNQDSQVSVASIEWSTGEVNEDKNCQQLSDTKTEPATNSSTPIGANKKDNKENSAADCINIGSISRNMTRIPDGPNNHKSRPPPTSTPLRKSSAASHIDHGSVAQIDSISHRLAKHGSSLPTDVRDSRFHIDQNVPFNASMSTIRPPLHTVNNNSMTIDGNSTMQSNNLNIPDLNNSYYQHIRILVQWKTRTLLIPIPR